MRRIARQLFQTVSHLAVSASLIVSVAFGALAQSNDLASPTPIYSPEIVGRIAPLDVGDPRQTRHFYAFNARLGDLELAVETNNLDGQIDLFAATTMRPLAQVTLYAGLGGNVTRTVFFRHDDAVILRVQARTPNDTEGTYRIRLGGTFAPSTLPPPAESASNAASEKPAEKGVRHVNSIGARIDEPKVEEASAPAATTSSEPGESATTPKPATSARTSNARTSASNRTTTARGGAARRGTARRTNTPNSAKTEPAKTDSSAGDTANKSETTEPNSTSGETTNAASSGNEPARTSANVNRARANRTRGARTKASGSTSGAANASNPDSSGASATTPTSDATTPATTALGLEAVGARVVLEMRDGTRIERAISEVRRFAIEGHLVVIVFKNGRVERHPLADVQRVAIEP
jgi:hypothetical protein